MNLFLHENFKLCISTLIFMLFDLYLIQYDTNKTQNDFNDILLDFKNKTVDIDELTNQSNVTVYGDIVSTDLETAINTQNYDLCYKLVSEINVDSGGAYEFTISNDVHSVACVLIKKFDKNNYIPPAMISFDDNYLNNQNREINVDNFITHLNNKKEIVDLLATFNI